jgi:hypothetical protein
VRNHNEKIKDMVASVLPSKARKGARLERRGIHHHSRARTRAAMASLDIVGPDDFDDPTPSEKGDIRELVRSRRDSDKVAPLVRWAVRRVAQRPELAAASLRDQLDYFRKVLPDNTIGRHALGHLSWTLWWEFHRTPGRPPAVEDQSVLGGLPYWDTYSSDDGPTAERLVADVRRILELGPHRELNTAIRRRTASEMPDRLLAGIHDVEAFVTATRPDPAIADIIARVLSET